MKYNLNEPDINNNVFKQLGFDESQSKVLTLKAILCENLPQETIGKFSELSMDLLLMLLLDDGFDITVEVSKDGAS